jgi:hypothetical protein
VQELQLQASVLGAGGVIVCCLADRSEQNCTDFSSADPLSSEIDCPFAVATARFAM